MYNESNTPTFHSETSLNLNLLVVKKSTMYQNSEIFEPQDARSTMEKTRSLQTLDHCKPSKPWEEEDAAIIAKSFTPVWEFNPLFSITDEIMKQYVANSWSRGERMPEHARPLMEEIRKRSRKGSSQFWEPWVEEDAAIITKSFTPFNITNEIMKQYVNNSWSRGERIQLIEYKRAEHQRSSSERIKLLRYVTSKNHERMIKVKKEALAKFQSQWYRGEAGL